MKITLNRAWQYEEYQIKLTKTRTRIITDRETNRLQTEEKPCIYLLEIYTRHMLVHATDDL